MNNYVIDVNGRRYLVLDVATKMSALNKIGDKINEGDVVNITVQSTNTDVFCLDGDDDKTESHPDEDEKKLTNPDPPLQQIMDPPKMESSMLQQPQPSSMISNLNIQMGKPISEPVGYVDIPTKLVVEEVSQTPTPPPMQYNTPQIIDRGERLRMEFLNKLRDNKIQLPNVKEVVRNWWYNNIINLMASVDGFVTDTIERSMQFSMRPGYLVTRIQGNMQMADNRILPLMCEFTLREQNLFCEFTIEGQAFLAIDINAETLTYDDIEYPDELNKRGIMQSYINYLFNNISIRTFRHK